MSDHLKTIKAIQVALKNIDYNDKRDMQMRLRIISGFVENTLEESKPEILEYKEVYDDENPDYIKQSIEEI